MNINPTLSYSNQEPEKSFLYMVGTPIGNLDDISLRAIKILKKVSYIACEDTRQTNKIMAKFELKNHLISFNKHNSFKRIPKIINDLKAGKSVALVSDAGLPSICDPGEDLVKNATSNGLNIICIPGPSAALTALVASGMPASRFVFEGFLRKKNIEREKILLEISKNIKTTVLFESPHRLKKLLIELRDFCGDSRKISIGRELTKKYEQHVGDNIKEAISYFKQNEPIGEFTIVIAGNEKSQSYQKESLDIIKRDLSDLIDAGLSHSAATNYLAKKNNQPKNKIYNLIRKD